jgi:dTDP-4-dehydrorhamnose 3,5-epimerase
MKIISTPIEGLFIIEPKVFRDDRGYFVELYNQQQFEEQGLRYTFIQDNQSCSTFGVIRGLHYQLEPYAQAKLVRAARGKILDVAVDLRKNSATFGKCYGVELSEDNFLQFLIPRGFAHGFSVLSDMAIVQYKCDNLYHPQSERGILFNDKNLDIDWKIPIEKAIVSSKDQKWPLLVEAEMNFL